jgi:hypothetical protein
MGFLSAGERVRILIVRVRHVRQIGVAAADSRLAFAPFQFSAQMAGHE